MKNCLLLFFIFLHSVVAQANGRLTGKVTDAKTGEALIGATIAIAGTGLGAVTDVDGNYVLSLPAGKYTCQILYLGYDKKEISDVVITESEATQLNITLNETKAKVLNEVVVKSTYKKENIDALYSIQKNASVVTSGISADLIQRAPDKNTGEVLKRVSGTSIQDNKFVIIRGLNDRYNATMINNAIMPSTEADRKAFSFDVIPANLIDNIIINKTATAELSGDFAGGIVQVLTKDVPTQPFLNIGVSLGYNTQSTFKPFNTQDVYGSRYLGYTGGANQLPDAFGPDYRYYKNMSEGNTNEAARTLSNNYTTRTITALPNTHLQMEWGNVIKLNAHNKIGTLVGVNFRNGFEVRPNFERQINAGQLQDRVSTESFYRYNASLAAMLNTTYMMKHGKISLKNLYNKLYDNDYYERTGFHYGSLQQQNLSSTMPSERSLINSQLEGEQRLSEGKLKFQYGLSYSTLRARKDDLRTAFYSRSATYDNKIFTPDVAQPFTLTDRNSRRMFENMSDHNAGGHLSISMPFNLLGNKQNLKVGYGYTFRTRVYGIRVFQYREGINIVQGINTLPADKLLTSNNISAQAYQLEEITNPQDYYGVNASNHAPYFMFDNSLGDKWKLNWGVRYERYTQTLILKAPNLTDLSTETIFQDLLPSFNLTYGVNEKNKLRLAASRTVNRPEFRELAPVQFFDFENMWQVTGNPNLVRARITNIDLKYELYPKAGELLSVGVFYKAFQNPIENQMDEQSTTDAMYFNFKQSPKATAYGAEIDLRRSLSVLALASWLNDITVAANLTYIKSRVDVASIVGGGSTTRPLQGQSPFLINLSVLYHNQKTGLSASALYNRIGDRIFIVGNKTMPTTWEKGRDVIDLQVAKSLFKNRAEIKFTLADLLNQHYLRYWKVGNEQYGYRPNSGDTYFNRYQRGTTYSLGFTYKLF